MIINSHPRGMGFAFPHFLSAESAGSVSVCVSALWNAQPISSGVVNLKRRADET